MNKSRQHISIAAIVATACVVASGCTAQLTEDERYERQLRQEERIDQIRSFIDGCEAAGRHVVYSGPVTHKLHDPVKRISRHAQPSDYQCASTKDIERMQVEAGIR